MESFWVDFNNMGKEGVRLTCKGTLDELKGKNIVLRDGLKFYIWQNDEDLDGNADNLTANATVKSNNSDMFIITQSEAAASLQACGTYKGKPQTGNQQTGNTSAYKRTRFELNNFVPLTPVLYLYGPQ